MKNKIQKTKKLTRFSDQKEYYLKHLEKQQKVKNNLFSVLGTHHKHLDDFIRLSIRKLPKGKKLLDAGCGLSQWITANIRNKYVIFGIDGEPDAIELCKVLFPNDDYRLGNLYDMDYKNNSFDCVVMREVIEHFKEPEKAVKEAYRILKPGGLFVLTTPNYGNLLLHIIEHTYNRFFGGPCKPYKKDVHPSKFNMRSLRLLLSKYFLVRRHVTIDMGISQGIVVQKRKVS